MDMAALSAVKFGDAESLSEFLLENGLQHTLFATKLIEQGFIIPRLPIMDASTDNLDDWLMSHQVEHQAFSAATGLDNPFNLLDMDWNDEESFYDWLATHMLIHEQLVAVLGV
jgi:hypothetical protein